jgi:hypothetical protein
LRHFMGSQLWSPLILPNPEALGVELQGASATGQGDPLHDELTLADGAPPHASQVSPLPGPPQTLGMLFGGNRPSVSLLRMRGRSASSSMAATFQ